MLHIQAGGVGSTLGSASSPFIPSSDFSPHPTMRNIHNTSHGTVFFLVSRVKFDKIQGVPEKKADDSFAYTMAENWLFL